MLAHKNDCSIIRRGDEEAQAYDEFKHNIYTAAIMVDEESEVVFTIPGAGSITDELMYSVLATVNKYFDAGVKYGRRQKAADIRRALEE